MKSNNNSDNYLIGSCKSLCPQEEINMRKNKRLIHFYEKNGIFIKVYSRSAADKKSEKAENLRTYEALISTIEYLFNTILRDSQKPLNFRYDFIFDRCRAIRQEIVIQNFSPEKTVALLEPIIMFLSYSLYKLNGLAINLFDAKICKQHLQECLHKCLVCYEEMNNESYKIKNRIVMEAISLMLNMDDCNSLRRAVKLNSELKSSFTLKTAIKISINFHQRNFHKVFLLIQDLPHLVGAIASLNLSFIRKEVFRIFSIAYNSQSLKVPIEFLQRLLIYDEKLNLLKDLSELGIHETSNENEMTAIIFNRKNFNSLKSISNTHQHFVDEKLRDFHLPDLILVKNI